MPQGHNTVQLLGHYGGDIAHACSAWTSTSRDLTEEKYERIPKLLTQLANDGHHTPFEKSGLHFLVTVDQATHIHLLKHRIGVPINAESARYKEFTEDKFYIPDDWPSHLKEDLIQHSESSFRLYHNVLAALQENGLSRKRAKESARYFLPYASQIQLDVMFNFRSFAHFMGLRDKPNAQEEVQQVALKMLQLTEGIEGDPFRFSITAFGLRKSTQMVIIEKMKAGKILYVNRKAPGSAKQKMYLEYISAIDPKHNPSRELVLVREYNSDKRFDMPFVYNVGDILVSGDEYALVDKNKIVTV